MPIVASNLNLSKNQLLNAVIQILTTSPISPNEGQIYYNSSDKTIYFYNGTSWVSVLDGVNNIEDVLATSPILVSVVDNVATISIQAASGTLNGYMSASDFTKLANATSLNTNSTLVLRDSNGRAKFSDPLDPQDAATKTYVDGLIDNTLRPPQPYDPTITSAFPLTYNSESIEMGDTFRITAAGNMGLAVVNAEDLLIALIDNPGQILGNWQILESNRDQATESIKGVLQIATQSEVTTGTNDSKAITPLKLKTELDSRLLTTTNKYVESSALIGTGNSPLVVTHNLNTRNVVVSLYDTTSFEQYIVDIEHTSLNTITIYSTGATKTVNITIIG